MPEIVLSQGIYAGGVLIEAGSRVRVVNASADKAPEELAAMAKAPDGDEPGEIPSVWLDRLPLLDYEHDDNVAGRAARAALAARARGNRESHDAPRETPTVVGIA